MIYDLRNDTVTKPDDDMRDAMKNAVVGDDVYEDDPTVKMLEEKIADLLGKENGIFVSSGTQSNLIAILSHSKRGEEFISGDIYHSICDEAGGAAVLGSVVPCALPTNSNGSISLEVIKNAIKSDDIHNPVTSLLCLENTVRGRIQTTNHLKKLSNYAHDKQLFTHLDGARLMNAVIESEEDIKEFTSSFDSVSLCLSKGLGAPVGSVLVGSKEFIKSARRLRKILGGGMRQVGVLASACIYAIENNINRLKKDHELAKMFANHISQIPEIIVNSNEVETNMVYIKLPESISLGLQDYLYKKDILISPPKLCPKGSHRIVFHKDIDRFGVEKLTDLIFNYLKSNIH